MLLREEDDNEETLRKRVLLQNLLLDRYHDIPLSARHQTSSRILADAVHSRAPFQPSPMNPAEDTRPTVEISSRPGAPSGLEAGRNPLATDSLPAAISSLAKQEEDVDMSLRACFRRGEGVPLVHPTDMTILTEYQLVVRESLALFEVKEEDLLLDVSLSNSMRRKVQVGQIGLRCRYCEHRPVYRRGSGAVYFPGNISNVYQAAQNMAQNHLATTCTDIPAQVRKRLAKAKKELKEQPRRSGGSSYWVETIRHCGLGDSVDQRGVWLKEEDDDPN